MKTGIELITEERRRQIDEKGYTSKHDDTHTEGEIADSAALYAMTEGAVDFLSNMMGHDVAVNLWAFDLQSLKPLDFEVEGRIKQLAKAGAMIAAEIDRLKRLER